MKYDVATDITGGNIREIETRKITDTTTLNRSWNLDCREKKRKKISLFWKENLQICISEEHAIPLSLPSSKIKLIVWHFYISTTNSFSLVSPNSHRKQGTRSGSCCTTNPWTCKASRSGVHLPFCNKGPRYSYSGLKSRKSPTNP